MRLLCASLAGLLSLSLVGCASRTSSTDDFLGLITPYRIDIVQGNVVTKEQLELLKPGLTRNQVRELLGTAMIADPFHADRWDYIFTIRRPGTESQRRSVIIHFDGESLKSVEAPDDLPTELEFVASISRQTDLRTPKLELSEDERKALPLPVRPPAPAPEPTGPVRDYPPLEPA